MKIFKTIALRTPVINKVVLERDVLRKNNAFLVTERDRLSQELDILKKRLTIASEELKAINNQQTQGYCHCCRQQTAFEIRGKWLRDEYFCLNCFSIPRQRHVQYVLDRYLRVGRKKPSMNRLLRIAL